MPTDQSTNAAMELSFPIVRKRIELADALRGFALMGLFIVHMVEYFELYWYRPEPGWVQNLVFLLFGAKAYGIFALLFGLSFFIILDNYRQRGVDFRSRFVWRLTLLLLFGYLHSLLYAGDILQLLALCGLTLVVTHHLSNRMLMMIAGFFLLQVPQLAMAFVHFFHPLSGYTQPAFIALAGANFAQFANADLMGLIAHNSWEGQWAKWAFFVETGRIWNIFGLMFVGALLGRTGFFASNRHNILRLMFIVLMATAAYAVISHLAPALVASLPDGMGRWCVDQTLVHYQNLSLICVGVVFFVLIYQIPLGKGFLNLWAPSGRLTLSFYIGQSLFLVPLFYGFGLAWWQDIGQVNALSLGVLLWLMQMGLAMIYVKGFRYGPFEWLWRKATFWNWHSKSAIQG